MSRILFPSLPVLLVDDEYHALKGCELALASSGIDNVISCQDSRKVMEKLELQPVSAIMLDLSMPHTSGQELLPAIIEAYPDVPVIIVTGANEVDTAVMCMQIGAFDYMVKPVEHNRLISGVKRAIEMQELRLECSTLKKRMLSEGLERPEAFAEIITNNQNMKSIFKYVEAVAPTSKTVLITGETGVGKELIAVAVHRLSGRSGQFVAVNVAGLDDNVFSDTLFGHTKGAFTGADAPRKGLIEQAADGTLFLDEIGDLSTATQVKLLRLLQDGEYLPLGADVTRHTNARTVVSTHRNLEELMNKGNFRKDLYYRLITHYVYIPPLRERKDDIELLVDSFLEESATELGKANPTPPKQLYTLLRTYHFPGNVRELKSLVFDALSRHRKGTLSLEVFRNYIGLPADSKIENHDEPEDPESLFRSLEELPSLRDAGRQLVVEAMRRSSGNQTIAARLLGITQSALSQRLKRHG